MRTIYTSFKKPLDNMKSQLEETIEQLGGQVKQSPRKRTPQKITSYLNPSTSKQPKLDQGSNPSRDLSSWLTQSTNKMNREVEQLSQNPTYEQDILNEYPSDYDDFD